jgi:site-specific recombinase XerD
MPNLALPFAASVAVPSLFAPDAAAGRRTVEFFTAHIRNVNTRKAYAPAGADFARWCERHRILDLRSVQPVHVAAYIEQLSLAAPSVKQRLAALRSLFDWLVVGHVLPVNPAASVHGPRHAVKTGKTPVLSGQEVRELIAAIETDTIIGLRDRALIGVMVYTFARVGAATRMRVEDVYTQRRRLWVRFHEKGGKLHDMPCHHNLEDWLHDYIQGARQAGDRAADGQP